jgi:hypothetical protein
LTRRETTIKPAIEFVNDNHFSITLGNYGFNIKAFPSEIKIEAKLDKRDLSTKKLVSVRDGYFDLVVTTDGRKLIVENSSGSSPTRGIDDIIRMIFSNLYQAFKLNE